MLSLSAQCVRLIVLLNAAQILQGIVRFAFSGKVSNGSWLFTAESGDVSALGPLGSFGSRLSMSPASGCCWWMAAAGH